MTEDSVTESPSGDGVSPFFQLPDCVSFHVNPLRRTNPPATPHTTPNPQPSTLLAQRTTDLHKPGRLARMGWVRWCWLKAAGRHPLYSRLFGEMGRTDLHFPRPAPSSCSSTGICRLRVGLDGQGPRGLHFPCSKPYEHGRTRASQHPWSFFGPLQLFDAGGELATS